MMVYLKSQREMVYLRASGELVSRTLAQVARHIEPGITPIELDQIAEQFVSDNGGVPAFKGYRVGNLQPFPTTLCVSVNDVIVHGIPDSYKLKEGDVVSIDCGVRLNNYYGDSAYTFTVGEVDAEDAKLCQTTYDALLLGIRKAVVNARIGDIGYTIQCYCEEAGYSIVRELSGHGIGRKLHEAPQVPNYGQPRKGRRVKHGMTICIEPMVNRGLCGIIEDRDGWTIRTIDGSTSAHYEHMVAITDDKPELLTTFDYIEEVIQSKPLLQTTMHG